MSSSIGRNMFRKPWWLMAPVLGVIVLLATLRQNDQADGQEKNKLTAKAQIVATFPHDSKDFCQGLVVEGNTVYEGTGQYGSSLLKKYDLETGKVLQQVALHQNYFGEGIAVIGEKLFQLTWKERVCVIYDKATLQQVGQLNYTGEGWGLATDGTHLFMSNGSAVIQVFDPETFKPIRKIRVTFGRKPQENLNELEFVGDELWACIWYEDRIARIDPETGKVKGYFDCSALYPFNQRPNREHVLNGIAFDATAKRLFITGKLWPKIFEVKLPQ
jgi:glutaminyl-peptide cyclotransferase